MALHDEVNAQLSLEDAAVGIVQAVREKIEEWAAKQGHQRCWYHPEIFQQIAGMVGAKVEYPKNLPPVAEFRKGCEQYTAIEYGVESGTAFDPDAHFVPEETYDVMREAAAKKLYELLDEDKEVAWEDLKSDNQDWFREDVDAVMKTLKIHRLGPKTP